MSGLLFPAHIIMTCTLLHVASDMEVAATACMLGWLQALCQALCPYDFCEGHNTGVLSHDDAMDPLPEVVPIVGLQGMLSPSPASPFWEAPTSFHLPPPSAQATKSGALPEPLGHTPTPAPMKSGEASLVHAWHAAAAQAAADLAPPADISASGVSRFAARTLSHAPAHHVQKCSPCVRSMSPGDSGSSAAALVS